MFLRTIGIFMALVMVQAIRAQVPSPEKFLGYPIGTRFTPHWKIMDYFRAVAAAAPATVKLEKYGETYEGRPLVVAYVSNATHISNLENIPRLLCNRSFCDVSSGQ